MHAQHSPGDDLSDLERLLTSWQPSAAGLDADSMLFAAGRASARGWRTWAGAAGLMTLLALGLLVALQAERQQRLALAQEVARLRSPAVEPPAGPAGPMEPASDGYLHLRNLVLEKGVEAWADEVSSRAGPDDRSPAAPVLRAGSPHRLIE